MEGRDQPSGPGAEAPPALESRIAQSKDIVTGTVTEVSDATVRIQVDEVLKGTATPGATLVVAGRTPPAVGELAVGDDGVWLISGVGDPPGLLGGGPVGVTVDQVRAALAGTP